MGKELRRLGAWAILAGRDAEERKRDHADLGDRPKLQLVSPST